MQIKKTYFLNNQKGLSMLELLFASSITIIVAFTLSKNQQSSLKSIKKVKNKLSRVLIYERLNRELKKNKNANAEDDLCASTDTSKITIEGQDVFKLDEPIEIVGGEFKVTSLNLEQIEDASFCLLKVGITPTVKAFGDQAYEKVLSFNVPKANSGNSDLWDKVSPSSDDNTTIYRDGPVRLGDKTQANAALDISLDENFPWQGDIQNWLQLGTETDTNPSVLAFNNQLVYNSDNCLAIEKENASPQTKFTLCHEKSSLKKIETNEEVQTYLDTSLDKKKLMIGLNNSYTDQSTPEAYTYIFGKNNTASGEFKTIIGNNNSSKKKLISLQATHHNLIIGENLKARANHSAIVGFAPEETSKLQNKDNHLLGTFTGGVQFILSPNNGNIENDALFWDKGRHLGIGKNIENSPLLDFKGTTKPKLYFDGEGVINGDLWVNGQKVETQMEDTGWIELNVSSPLNACPANQQQYKSPPKYRIVNKTLYLNGCVKGVTESEQLLFTETLTNIYPGSNQVGDKWQKLVHGNNPNDPCLFSIIKNNSDYDSFQFKIKGHDSCNSNNSCTCYLGDITVILD